MSNRHRNPGDAARRRFVSAVLGSAVQTCVLPWPSRAASAQPRVGIEGASIAKTLEAFLDTLLPRDALSGSASELGVPTSILGESAGNSAYSELIAKGCKWLDLAALGNFAASAPRERHAIVGRMADAKWDTAPRSFYEVLRQRAIEIYYGRPEGWGGLPISSPPQPIGYPDYLK